MKFSIFAIVACATPLVIALPPEVSNVRANQVEGTKLVDIYYDATDADGDLLKVRVEISDNDGLRYSVPAFSLTGDIGEGIEPGRNKHIVWDAGADWDGEYSDKMRVKVFAIDAKGFPGMEWSNEILPGGFLLGQDGGLEGSGLSRHVNITWSYWVTKYEVTAQQYCDFLNAASVAGFVSRNGTGSALATDMMPATYGCPVGSVLCCLGDSWCVRWNVNNFEVIPGCEDKPAVVTWFGAMAFCRFYGYDLPTEAEWEKAARGPDNDDQDEHLVYPWGNTCSQAQAYVSYSSTYSRLSGLTSVKAYDNQINGYGVCDVIGNAAEWTRSSAEDTIESYPASESLSDDRHLPYLRMDRVVKGVGSCGIYYRKSVDEGQVYCATNNYAQYFFTGFRPVRRGLDAQDVVLTRELLEDFNGVASSLSEYSHQGKSWRSDGSYIFRPGVGVDESAGVNPTASTRLYIPSTQGDLCFIRMKAKNTGSSSETISCKSSLGSGDYVTLGAYMTDFETVQLSVVKGASNYYIYMYSTEIFDDIELWTVPKK